VVQPTALAPTDGEFGYEMRVYFEPRRLAHPLMRDLALASIEA
jgi:hypothetical protein